MIVCFSLLHNLIINFDILKIDQQIRDEMEADYKLYQEREVAALEGFEDDNENFLIEGGDCAQSLGVVSDDCELQDTINFYETQEKEIEKPENPFKETQSKFLIFPNFGILFKNQKIEYSNLIQR